MDNVPDEKKLRCPFCGKCIGICKGTDMENSISETLKSAPR